MMASLKSLTLPLDPNELPTRKITTLSDIQKIAICRQHIGSSRQKNKWIVNKQSLSNSICQQSQSDGCMQQQWRQKQRIGL